MATHTTGITQEYLDLRERGRPSLVKSLPGSNFAVALARIPPRLESSERDSQGTGQWQPIGQVAPPHDRYAGGKLGLDWS